VFPAPDPAEFPTRGLEGLSDRFGLGVGRPTRRRRVTYQSERGPKWSGAFLITPFPSIATRTARTNLVRGNGEAVPDPLPPSRLWPPPIYGCGARRDRRLPHESKGRLFGQVRPADPKELLSGKLTYPANPHARFRLTRRRINYLRPRAEIGPDM
jgi:hypothetical protein